MAAENIWRLRPAARQDLAQIWQEGADTWGVDRADHYLDGLFAVFDLLADFPEMARLRHAFRPPVRIHPSGRHLILYQEAGQGGVDILRLLHGKQNVMDYLTVS